MVTFAQGPLFLLGCEWLLNTLGGEGFARGNLGYSIMIGLILLLILANYFKFRPGELLRRKKWGEEPKWKRYTKGFLVFLILVLHWVLAFNLQGLVK
jgi:hypothetical protein